MIATWEYFEDFVRIENSRDYRLLQKNSREIVVGVERFELPPHNELPNENYCLYIQLVKF